MLYFITIYQQRGNHDKYKIRVCKVKLFREQNLQRRQRSDRLQLLLPEEFHLINSFWQYCEIYILTNHNLIDNCHGEKKSRGPSKGEGGFMYLLCIIHVQKHVTVYQTVAFDFLENNLEDENIYKTSFLYGFVNHYHAKAS